MNANDSHLTEVMRGIETGREVVVYGRCLGLAEKLHTHPDFCGFVSMDTHRRFAFRSGSNVWLTDSEQLNIKTLTKEPLTIKVGT